MARRRHAAVAGARAGMVPRPDVPRHRPQYLRRAATGRSALPASAFCDVGRNRSPTRDSSDKHQRDRRQASTEGPRPRALRNRHCRVTRLALPPCRGNEATVRTRKRRTDARKASADLERRAHLTSHLAPYRCRRLVDRSRHARTGGSVHCLCARKTVSSPGTSHPVRGFCALATPASTGQHPDRRAQVLAKATGGPSAGPSTGARPTTAHSTGCSRSRPQCLRGQVDHRPPATTGARRPQSRPGYDSLRHAADGFHDLAHAVYRAAGRRHRIPRQRSHARRHGSSHRAIPEHPGDEGKACTRADVPGSNDGGTSDGARRDAPRGGSDPDPR